MVDRGRLVDGGGLVSRGGGGLVLGGGGAGVAGRALVLHVGDVAGVVVGDVVAHDLGAAVGEEDAVLAVGGVAVAGLARAEVDTGVLVPDAVLVAVVGGGLLVLGRSVAGAVGEGNGGQGEDKDVLELIEGRFR